MRRSITVFPKLTDKEVSSIAETRKQYARAFNMASECLINNNSTSKRFLHNVQYGRIKEECPSLPTGLIQCARDVVDARYTSRKCSVCKTIDKASRNGNRYTCRHCGSSMHADTNAAINIRDNYITRTQKSGQAAVNQPYGWGARGNPETEPLEKTLTSKPSGLPEGC